MTPWARDASLAYIAELIALYAAIADLFEGAQDLFTGERRKALQRWQRAAGKELNDIKLGLAAIFGTAGREAYLRPSGSPATQC
jgi:hypothetical protein